MKTPMFFPPRRIHGREIRGWIYRNLFFEIPNNRVVIDAETGALIVQHWVSKQESQVDKLRQKETVRRTPHRQSIPESVRMYVWQRDKGQCVKCEARADLEYDHINSGRSRRQQHRAQCATALRTV
jgi:5-methylcytosine-specific restriction endonuclease McrA